MKKICFLFFLLATSSVQGQELLDLLGQLREKHELPALSYVAVNPTRIVNSGTNGYLNLGDSTAVAHLNARFHLGSNSKAITAMIAFEVVKIGKINWESSIGEVLPELLAAMNPVFSSKTLEELLTHRAFIQPHMDGGSNLQWYVCETTPTACRLAFTAAVLQEDAALPDPQRAFVYSNAGYVIASAMLERVTQLSFENLLELYINQKNGTQFKIGWPSEVDSNSAIGHLTYEEMLMPAPELLYTLGPVFAAAGNINGSVFDQGIFLQAYLLALQTTSEDMTREEGRRMLFGKPEYAFGWLHSTQNEVERAVHDGSAGTFYCRWIIIDDYQLGIVLNTNSSGRGARDAFSTLGSLLELRFKP